MDAEFENCRDRLAMGGCARRRGSPAQERAGHRSTICDHRCRFEEGLALAQDALRSRRGARRTRSSQALLLARRRARAVPARSLSPRPKRSRCAALDAARAARDHSAQALCLNVLGSCCLRLGRYADAGRHFRQGLKLAHARKEAHNTAATLDHVALVEKWMGHYDEALRLVAAIAGGAPRLGRRRRRGAVPQQPRRAAPGQAGLRVRRRVPARRARDLRPRRSGRHARVHPRQPDRGRGQDRRSRCRGAMPGARSRARPRSATGRSWPGSSCSSRGWHDGARRHRGGPRASSPSRLPFRSRSARRRSRSAACMVFAEILAAQGEVAVRAACSAFAADHPSTSAPERDEIRATARRSCRRPRERCPPGPAIELDELVDRIVVEADVGVRTADRVSCAPTLPSEPRGTLAERPPLHSSPLGKGRTCTTRPPRHRQQPHAPASLAQCAPLLGAPARIAAAAARNSRIASTRCAISGSIRSETSSVAAEIAGVAEPTRVRVVSFDSPSGLAAPLNLVSPRRAPPCMTTATHPSPDDATLREVHRGVQAHSLGHRPRRDSRPRVRLRQEVHARRTVEDRRARLPAAGRRRASCRRSRAGPTPTCSRWSSATSAPRSSRSASEHWLGDQVALEALVRLTDEELKHQELFRRLDADGRRRHAGGLPLHAAAERRRRRRAQQVDLGRARR